MIMLAVEMIAVSVMILTVFVTVAATVVVTSLILGKCQAAAKREYGRDEHV
jgi:hypothetical protein